MKRIPSTLLLLFVSTALLIAQNRVVTGTVTGAEGQALPGASVQIKGALLGAITTADGSYRLEVPPGFNTLVFSYLGHQTQEVDLAGRQRIDVQLQETAGYLNEVVVTGFGTQSKRRLTSSISSVNQEVFENIPVSDFQNALQGRMAGVVFSNTSGTTNSPSSIRIRGIGSISASNQPIIVVDGLVLSGRINAPHYSINTFGASSNPFINLNPNDIESVEVLKDAAASAIYGSRGSNGVILITTKSGQFNMEPKVRIGYWAGFSEASNKLELLNGKEWAESWNQAAMNNPTYTGPLLDPEAQPSTDWVDLLQQKGFEQEINASVSGGTKATKFYIGGTVRDETGYLKNTAFKRYAVRANIDQLIGDKITLGVSLAPSRTDNSRPNDYDAPYYWAFFTPPNIAAFDANGKPRGFAEIAADGGFGSPLTNLTETNSNLTSNQMLFNSYINYNVLPSLTLKTSFSVESTQMEELYKYGRRTYTGYYSSGFGIAFDQETFNYNWTALATWQKKFNKKHDLDITAGLNLTKESLTSTYIEGRNYADDQLLYIGSAAQTTTTGNYTEAGFTGVLARANYAYANKYLLTLSARYDGSSRFGVEKRYGFFPAVSAGWIISDEGFFNPGFVDFLKIRSSFGIAGNAEIGDFAAKGLVRFGQNYNGLPGYDIRNIENEQLGWEKNVQWDVGLDFGLFKNRIRGSVGYYIKDTKDLLLDVPVPATNGFEILSQNAGEVRNQGFEFELSADILTGAFQWAIQANGATLKNEVRKLIDTDGNGQDDDDLHLDRFLIRPGLSIGTFHLVEFAGVDPDNGDALFWNADKTQKLANTVPESNRRIVGNSIPDFTGGFTNIFRYKNFELSAFFQLKTGFQSYMLYGQACAGIWGGYSNAIKECADDVWTPDNRNTNVPQNRLGILNGQQRSSRNIYNGDYLRLKNLTIGYTFSAFGARNNRLYLFASGQNIWTLTDYPDLDPDTSFYSAGQAAQGATLGQAPLKRTFSLGFNLDF